MNFSPVTHDRQSTMLESKLWLASHQSETLDPARKSRLNLKITFQSLAEPQFGIQQGGLLNGLYAVSSLHLSLPHSPSPKQTYAPRGERRGQRLATKNTEEKKKNCGNIMGKQNAQGKCKHRANAKCSCVVCNISTSRCIQRRYVPPSPLKFI